MIIVNIVALFHKKARLMTRGQRNTWRILRQTAGDGGYVWFHAASLGEFEQGRPLMERLRRTHPDQKILLTFFSPSGYEVRRNYAGADIVCYLPFDTPLNARKFIRLVRPTAAYFIKYEFWRNYIEVLHQHNIPTYSVSSIFREGQIFFRPYGKSYARCLRRITHFFVQNEASKALLAKIGVENVSVVGDTRFDRVIDIKNEAKELPLCKTFAQGKNVLVAGSSWGADEDILIDYFNRHDDWRLILAPHVVSEEHLHEIESKLKRPALRYTEANAENVAQAECLIINCYGLLSSIYRYAKVAYVGGGFGVGIHNVPEAAVYGIPVFIGPNNGKFREAQALLKNGGCIEIHGAEDFERAMTEFAEHPEKLQHAGEMAERYIHENAGAADQIFEAVMK